MTSRFFDVVENFREERGIDMWSDGLMFDMLDAFISETEEMLGVLNGNRGAEKGSKAV